MIRTLGVMKKWAGRKNNVDGDTHIQLDVASLLHLSPDGSHHASVNEGTMKQYRYIGKDGEFDYEQYRKAQVRANKKKIEWQWTTDPAIKFLAKNIVRILGKSPKHGLCHGTRRGLEQQSFAKHIPGCKVLGTEISDTADQFPHTIQWDFHDVKPEWVGKFDFVYSNSWDHSYDPVKLFSAWMSELRPGGICLLEHTRSQWRVSESDPLGMTVKQLTMLLKNLGYNVIEIIKDGPKVGQCWKEEGFETVYLVIKRK